MRRREPPRGLYEEYLLDRWNAGHRNGAQLYREIRKRGYPGGRSQVKRLVTRLRQAQGLCPGQRVVSTSRPILSTDLDLRSPRRARWLFLRRPEDLTNEQRDAVERLRQHEELCLCASMERGVGAATSRTTER
jgi:hypothetical protein